jgi:GAF domain-containing protein
VNRASEEPRSQRPTATALRTRELDVAREIADAFLTATTPVEVYRLALARVTPLAHASFACVFLRDEEEPDLLRMTCAQNWPQSTARFLGDLRIREGRGPTGEAVAHRQPRAVADVFDDPALADWWEPARELGFVSMIALPLVADEHAFGALSFYFGERKEFEREEIELLRVVAHQLATTAERAHLIADLRSSNLRLERENEALRRQISTAEAILVDGEEAEGTVSRRSGPAEGSR